MQKGNIVPAGLEFVRIVVPPKCRPAGALKPGLFSITSPRLPISYFLFPLFLFPTHQPYLLNPAIKLIVSATTKVFSAKEISPWPKTIFLSFLLVICTSDT